MQKAPVSIHKYLNAVLSKRPVQAVVLWGEPGIGKTHAAQAILRETPCRSFGLAATTPDLGLAQALPRPAALSPQAQRVLTGLEKGQTIETSRLVEALCTALSELAPVILHLDDLHEARPERLELVRRLAQALPKLRGVGLLLTGRAALEGFQSFELERLSREESDAMLTAHLNAALPAEGLEWIYSRALGNPLFSLEYLTYLSRQGCFWFDGTRWHWQVHPEASFPRP